MERKINDDLLKWKRDSLSNPFFLYGPRCIGKTFTVLEFGKKYYQNIAYFNTLNNDELINLFDKEKVLDKLIKKLSIICGESIFKEETLIVFDNLNDSKLMKELTVFGNNSDYHVIIISSDKIMINKSRVEGFYYRSMFQMDFFEYLSCTDKVSLIDFIKDSYENNTPMPFHQMALDAYYEYLETGGYPEVVLAKQNKATELEIDAIKGKILEIIRADYANYDNGNNYAKTDEIIRFLPEQLIKENKKFQYGLIKRGARSKDYEQSINNLVTNGIIHRSYRLEDVKSPLSSNKDLESFKLYFNDVGLLYTSLFLNKAKLMMNEDIRRSLVENDVANSLIKLGYSLYYYQSDGKAEIQFVIQNRSGKIIPIEVVNMKLTKAKAMSMFLKKYEIADCIRLTEDNFSKKKNVRLIPIYASICLKDI